MIKTLSIIFTSILGLSSLCFHGQDSASFISQKSEIKNITIHNVGAHIERIGTANINLGANQLIINNLSPSLTNESIQFVMNSNNVIVNSISKKMNYLNEETNGNLSLIHI